MAHTYAFEDCMLTRTNIKKNEFARNDKPKIKLGTVESVADIPTWISQCEEYSNTNALLYFFWEIMKKNKYSGTSECLKSDILKKIVDTPVSSHVFKKTKMSKSEVTIELRGDITRRGLELLCMLYDISIIFIYGKMYNKFNHNYDCSEKINGMIKYDIDCKYYLCLSEHSEFINDTLKQYFYVSNYEKPLKCISSYSLEDLQKIAHKFEISTVDDTKNAGTCTGTCTGTIKTKNKTKTKLYEELIVDINKIELTYHSLDSIQ